MQTITTEHINRLIGPPVTPQSIARSLNEVFDRDVKLKVSGDTATVTLPNPHYSSSPELKDSTPHSIKEFTYILKREDSKDFNGSIGETTFATITLAKGSLPAPQWSGISAFTIVGGLLKGVAALAKKNPNAVFSIPLHNSIKKSTTLIEKLLDRVFGGVGFIDGTEKNGVEHFLYIPKKFWDEKLSKELNGDFGDSRHTSEAMRWLFISALAAGNIVLANSGAFPLVSVVTPILAGALGFTLFNAAYHISNIDLTNPLGESVLTERSATKLDLANSLRTLNKDVAYMDEKPNHILIGLNPNVREGQADAITWILAQDGFQTNTISLDSGWGVRVLKFPV